MLMVPETTGPLKDFRGQCPTSQFAACEGLAQFQAGGINKGADWYSLSIKDFHLLEDGNEFLTIVYFSS